MTLEGSHMIARGKRVSAPPLVAQREKNPTLKGSYMIAGGKQTRVCAAPGLT